MEYLVKLFLMCVGGVGNGGSGGICGREESQVCCTLSFSLVMYFGLRIGG